MKRLVVALLFVAVLAALGCSKKEGLPALEGNPAPDFTVKDLNGKELQLSTLKGKVVLVNFWATWCPPCREEIPSMMKLNQAMQGMLGPKFQMLAISIDEGGRDAVTQFFSRSGAMLPAYLDTDGKISRRYGTTGVPETFVVDKKGVIRAKVVGGLDWTRPDVVQLLVQLAQEK